MQFPTMEKTCLSTTTTEGKWQRPLEQPRERTTRWR
jgi:hypothetical protein